MKRTLIASLLVGIAMAGCRSGQKKPATAVATRPATTSVERAGDPTPRTPVLVWLQVYEIALPYGSVSGSEEFWRHVNEQIIDAGNYELLLKNGIRVGQAQTNDWKYFKDILDKNPAAARMKSYQAVDLVSIEMPMKEQIAEQTVFYYNARDGLEGRSYDASQNFFAVSFQPAPRRLGDVRVSVCPVIRGLRKKYVFVGDADQREVQYIAPERYYDLALRTDISLDRFLVIAPSPQAAVSMTLGRQFLVADGPAERQEMLILMVPTLLRMQPGRTGDGAVAAPARNR